jgi:hypothetical protein
LISNEKYLLYVGLSVIFAANIYLLQITSSVNTANMSKVENSTIALISKFLEKQSVGQTFVYSDFENCGSYTCIRSAVMRLCEKKELMRLCQGVYMKPGGEVPDSVHLAKEIARRNSSKSYIKSDELLGSTRVIKINTDGATRNITLPNGTVLKYHHTEL